MSEEIFCRLSRYRNRVKTTRNSLPLSLTLTSSPGVRKRATFIKTVAEILLLHKRPVVFLHDVTVCSSEIVSSAYSGSAESETTSVLHKQPAVFCFETKL